MWGRGRRGRRRERGRGEDSPLTFQRYDAFFLKVSWRWRWRCLMFCLGDGLGWLSFVA